jgi:O-antigen/teichoic acid export membrane protein
MAHWKRNTVANYAGTAWTGAARLIAAPLYIKFLGLEAFGLIGFYMSIQAILSGADFGLAPTLSRVLARATGGTTDDNSNAVIRSLERIGLVIAIALAGAVALSAHYIAYDWLRDVSLSLPQVEISIVLMGATGACRWLSNFYRGGLLGLQRQILLNILQSTFATLRWIAVLLPIEFSKSPITAFFWFQLMVGVIELLAYRMVLTHSIRDYPWSRAGRDMLTLAGHGRFATAMSILSVTGIVLTQFDKIILSRLLPLAEFGYYSLAVTIATAFVSLATPIFNAAYPHLTECFARHDLKAVRASYHRATQLMSFLLIPSAFAFVYTSYDVIALWTGSPSIAAHSRLLASILVSAAVIHGLTYMPYALQMAAGWVRPSLVGALVSVVIYIPGMLFVVPRYGAIGAAGMWLGVNVIVLLLVVPVAHMRLLPKINGLWYRKDVAPTLLSSAAAILLLRILGVGETGGHVLSLAIGLQSVATTIIVMLLLSAAVNTAIRTSIIAIVRTALTEWRRRP